MLVRALVLLLPPLLGFLAGATRLFGRPDLAVTHLNRYAMYFAFPALVFAGLADAHFALPTGPAFWLVVPAALAVVLSGLGALGRGPARGSLALVASFGNVAYLGLPVVAQVLGTQALGTASLAVAIHITLSMSLGPWLLMRWGRAAGARRAEAPLRTLLGQPLLWAPVLGLAARSLPASLRTSTVEVVGPVGASAAPVALFLLGLYLHTHRRSLWRMDRSSWLHVATKLLAVPGVTLALTALGGRLGWLTPLEAQVLLLLAAMPAAITTFAIAQELEIGVARVTQTIVASSLLCVVTVPAFFWLGRLVLG